MQCHRTDAMRDQYVYQRDRVVPTVRSHRTWMLCTRNEPLRGRTAVDHSHGSAIGMLLLCHLSSIPYDLPVFHRTVRLGEADLTGIQIAFESALETQTLSSTPVQSSESTDTEVARANPSPARTRVIREPYTGGPVPAGARLETRRPLALGAVGLGAFILGYTGSVIGAVGMYSVYDPVAPSANLYVPFVRAFIDLASANGRSINTVGLSYAIFSTALQLAGVALALPGFLLEKRLLVYEVTLGRRDRPPMRWALLPIASDTSLGAVLYVSMP
jgi:hypothetical protein